MYVCSIFVYVLIYFGRLFDGHVPGLTFYFLGSFFARLLMALDYLQPYIRIGGGSVKICRSIRSDTTLILHSASLA